MKKPQLTRAQLEQALAYFSEMSMEYWELVHNGLIGHPYEYDGYVETQHDRNKQAFDDMLDQYYKDRRRYNEYLDLQNLKNEMK